MPPGGATDVLARFLVEKTAPAPGQPFVVENRPGAGGILGTDALAKAASEVLHDFADPLGRRAGQPGWASSP